MNKSELGRAVYRVAHLTGKFLLRSGQTSNEYFDKYRFESDPQLLKSIAENMVPLIPKETQVLAGLELGGVPIATALSLTTGLPCVFVRKVAKEYGTRQIAEGVSVSGKNVLIIEDVITTGGQVLFSAEDLRQLGAHIDHVMCVILRNDDAIEKLAAKNLILLPLLTRTDLKD